MAAHRITQINTADAEAEASLYNPRLREPDAILLMRIASSLEATAATLEQNARYYQDLAAQARGLRAMFTPSGKPPALVLRESIGALSQAGHTHTGHVDDGTSAAADAGITAWRILQDEFLFHNGIRYDKSDEVAMRQYRIATGQERAPFFSRKEIEANRKAFQERVERLASALESVIGAFNDTLGSGTPA